MMICVGTKFKSLHVVGSKCSVKFGFAENVCWFLAIFDKIDKSADNFFSDFLPMSILCCV